MQITGNPFNEKENLGIGKRTDLFTPSVKKTATPKLRTGKLGVKDVNTPAVKKLGLKDVNTPSMPKKLGLKDLNTPAMPKILGLKDTNTPSVNTTTKKTREKVKRKGQVQNETRDMEIQEVEYCPPTAKELEFVPHPDDIIDIDHLQLPVFNPYKKKDTEIFDRIMDEKGVFDDMRLYLDFPDIPPAGKYSAKIEFEIDTTLNLEF
ncbi:hypothetical protein HDV01_002792 [Terramyces sp. JEL0728]|nr:hypothetical protein HDV01_002792 [Terramyces sp. JEL0728]